VPPDDRALSRALASVLPAPPNEVAFVDTDPRYGLRFYLDSEIERLELPGDDPKPQAQDIASEMREHEGCRVLLVNDYNAGRLEDYLARYSIAHKRVAELRGYVAFVQRTPDCDAYASF